MTAMRIIRPTALLALMVAVAGCASPWPPEASGGAADRLGAAPHDYEQTRQTLDRAVRTGTIAPARAAAARERLALAIREQAAGLAADADAHVLAVSISLGGADIPSASGHQTCLKAPCN